MTCQLCRADRELRRSHVIPAFLYRGERGDRDLGEPGGSRLERPVREHLLCDGCEGFLNDHYEQPFRREWRRMLAVSSGLRPPDVRFLEDVDYAAVKLFLLSVFFRASVASRSPFGPFDLPPADLEAVRDMIRAREPGPDTRYPIVCRAVVDRRGRVVHSVQVPLRRTRFARTVLTMVFGGFEWNVFATTTHVPEIAAIRLSSVGLLPLAASSADALAGRAGNGGSRLRG